MNIKLECARCGNGFQINTVHLKSIGLHQIPDKCPTCCDRSKHHPAARVVVRREMIEEWDRVRIAIPTDFFTAFHSRDYGDRPCRRASLRGNMGQGVSWDGRIDLYDFRYHPEHLGRVRLMEVEHEAGEERIERRKSESGEILEEKIAYSPVYRYLSIDPLDGPVYDEHSARAAMVFARVEYKTTLKGFGRQYYAGIDADRAIWSMRMSSQARSGRFGTEMVLAIVDDEHPIVSKVTGDIQNEKWYTLRHPHGADIAETAMA